MQVRDVLIRHPGGTQSLDREHGQLKLRFKAKEGFVVSSGDDKKG